MLAIVLLDFFDSVDGLPSENWDYFCAYFGSFDHGYCGVGSSLFRVIFYELIVKNNLVLLLL